MIITRRTFIRGVIGTAVVAAGTAIVGCDTHDIEKKTVHLSVGLNTPLRVVALGDIHFDPLYDEAYLEEIVRQVNALKADLVAFTGDFITQNVLRVDDLARTLGGVEARLGAVAILGNHDMWCGPARVAQALRSNGIQVLRNNCHSLPGEENFFVTGLESYWGGHPDPAVISRTPANSRHILLVHEPDPYTHLADPRIKLQISGHTHGGQVRVPLIGAVILPRFGQNYQQGLYVREGSPLYVNRGVGTLRLHIRFDCRPEITIFELT